MPERGATRARFTFRTKLLASYLVLVLVVELITILVLNRSLASDLVQHLDERLAEQARGSAAWVSARLEQHSERFEGMTADRQAIRLAGVVHAWVTIIDSDGDLIGDSERARGGEPDLHAAARPEITEARTNGVGTATRWSDRHFEDMHFVAVLDDSGNIVRLAVPLAEINATIRAMRNRLLVASAAGFLVALVLGLLAARVVAQPLRVMTAAAVRIAQGDYKIEMPAAPPDEFGTLAGSLASLASQLEARIGDLTNERDRLSAILGAMVEGVLVIGPDRRVVLANPSASRIVRADRELVGRDAGEAIADPELLGVLDEVEKTAEAQELELDADKHDRGRSLIVNARPLGSAAGGGVVAVLHDVTHLRRLESMRRDFVANVSHELRTPVTAIQGYSETLLRGAAAADGKTRGEFLEIIHRHARRIGRLVEDLLRLAEIEARPPEKVVLGPVRLFDIGSNVAETARDKLNARKARLDVSIAPDAIVLGDAVGIEQVFDNLVDNAIKYGREGGVVTLEARRVDDRVVATVSDDGPGIAAQHLPRIFERFYRVDAGRSRELGGTGLGLAIVKRLVESMGGAISAESDAGNGARFIIELPATTLSAPPLARGSSIRGETAR